MTIKTPAATAALLFVLAPLSLATAQTSSGTYVFETVDSIDAYSSVGLRVTGILQGEATPRTVSLVASSSNFEGLTRACERYALIAMSRPGQYYLEARRGGTYLEGCKLTRR